MRYQVFEFDEIVKAVRAQPYEHVAFTRTVRGKQQTIAQKGVPPAEMQGAKRQVKPKADENPKGAAGQSKQIVRGLNYSMRIFKQTQGMCGPASVRIALSAFGKKYSEKQIAKLAGSTAAEGTGHNQLVKAIKKSGIHTTTFQNLSKAHALEVLRLYSGRGNPIIIDWMKTKLQRGGDTKASEGMKPGKEEAKTKKDIRKEENEHFSVVQRVDDESIYLLDPLESKVEKLPIKYFMDRWMTVSEKVNRWFTVLEKT